MPKKEHDWEINSEPPLIDDHTIIKHQIYQDYITEYIKTLNKRPSIPDMKFAVVDAFAGGGLYIDKDKVEHQGSPVKIWEAMQAGEYAVNQNRNNEFTLKRKLFLLEKKTSNFNYLKHHLSALEYDKWFDKNIILNKGSFVGEYKSIIDEIHEKLGNNTRVIFILDQYGYKDVPFSDIRNIFKNLPNSEVILTLSVDDIIDYLPNSEKLKDIERYPIQKTLNAIGLDTELMSRIKTDTTGNTGRAAIERHITEQLLLFTEAKHFSPFFLTRKNSHKSMWLVHLANHSEATNVMKSIYHKYGNQDKTIVSHYGGAGLDMLGYDRRADSQDDYLFKDCDEYNFNEMAKRKSHEKLLEDIPRKLHSEPATFESFYDKNASHTPADKKMFRDAVIKLIQHKEIIVEGKNRRSSIKNEDILLINPQCKVF